MLQDLDATLAALVQAELGVQNVAISFAAPGDQFPPSGVSLPAIDFFLYDVREDHDLRTSEWETDRRLAGTVTMVTRKRPPARVTCSYLITAWPSASVPDPARDEHQLLGEVMKVLLRHRMIPATYLRGELAVPPPAPPPPLPARIVAEGRLYSLGEFWQAMGGRPKATLHYAVTISVDVFEAVDVGQPVETKIITINQGAALPELAVPSPPARP